MPKVAIRCGSSHDENCDFDWAVVDLTVPLVALIKKRLGFLARINEEEEDLAHIQFFDYSPSFYSKADFEKWRDAQPEGADASWYDDVESGIPSGVVPLPDSLEPGDGHASTDLGCMLIYADGVAWEVIPKHTSVIITTERLSWENLEKYGAKPAGRDAG